MGLAVPDYAKAVEFYTGVWGLEKVASDSGVTFLGTPADPEQYIIRLRADSDKRLDLISFGAESAQAVDALAERLITDGVRLDREPAKLDTPGGGYGIRFFDLDGRLVEVSADVTQRSFRPLEERESIPKRLSHVVFNSTDVVATKAFYERNLGFRLSDWAADMMCFLRTRTQHHILAISKGPHVALNHVSFEMRGIDEYMRGTGRMIRAGRKPIWGPGRHSAGDNPFAYFLDPANNVVEYTTELEEIVDEDTWQPRVFAGTAEAMDQWGTAGSVHEQMIPAMFNEPDTGLWTASPV
ncbi:VOC family protein [Mycobacterium lentiflavum]|uniref:VOC family protein n=1 Tax=Mycobacterium lentiflavum TaxID=141349 RepID=A0ABY3UPU7_MYCLN|nr:VOC family protein [Mycobacterium lentiflavum]ULP41605.1 VOC family protein [Mycobacterium lentiflavum]